MAKKKVAKKTAKKTTKKTAKKTTKKTTKKTASRAAVTKSAPAKVGKITPSPKQRTKGDVYNTIATQASLSRKEVVGVFDALSGVLAADLGKRGPGVCLIPGLAKVVVQRKPATKSRKGVNPFTGEEMVFKAKPARNVVKVRPLKGLKEMV